MDSMAANGVHLKNAFVTTSLCSPSRASILTGLYTFRHRVIDNNRPVPQGTVFFPQYLQKAGYATAFFGKWHMGGGSDEPRPGLRPLGQLPGPGPLPAARPGLHPQRRRQAGEAEGLHHRRADRLRGRLAQAAEAGARSRSSCTSPTRPCTPTSPRPSGTRARYADVAVHPPGHPRRTPQANYGMQAALAARPAQQLARRRLPLPQRARHREVLQALLRDPAARSTTASAASCEQLKEMGIHDETLVIYMGDNGFMFGEHGLIDKRVAYETSIRVPDADAVPGPVQGRHGGRAGGRQHRHRPDRHGGRWACKTPPHMDGAQLPPAGPGQGDPVARLLPLRLLLGEELPAVARPSSACAATGTSTSPTTGSGTPTSSTISRTTRRRPKNLLADPAQAKIARQMENQLYRMMAELGGMEIPLNQPAGGFKNKRLRSRGGDQAADFPRRWWSMSRSITMPTESNRGGSAGGPGHAPAQLPDAGPFRPPEKHPGEGFSDRCRPLRARQRYPEKGPANRVLRSLAGRVALLPVRPEIRIVGASVFRDSFSEEALIHERVLAEEIRGSVKLVLSRGGRKRGDTNDFRGVFRISGNWAQPGSRRHARSFWWKAVFEAAV